MRFVMTVRIPHKTFNEAIKKGTAAKKMMKILEAIKPEAAYFTEMEGHRGGYLIVDMEHSSQIPSLAEPWFLEFEADCTFRPCMTPGDLQESGLEKLGKKWG